jgi:hypothetical protein
VGAGEEMRHTTEAQLQRLASAYTQPRRSPSSASTVFLVGPSRSSVKLPALQVVAGGEFIYISLSSLRIRGAIEIERKKVERRGVDHAVAREVR